MTVLFSPQANADLRSINRHIARSNPGRAATFTAELVAPDDAVAILHVLHGSRDYERLLFPSD